ncbi:hypothetical protein BGW42_003852 [Actinomortierella wolfii]|nr:hypothetical protein BGW42_003852 [Actinomortierella wolfii]
MSGQASFIAPTSVLKPIASTAASTAIASSSSSSLSSSPSGQQQFAFRNRSIAPASTNEQVSSIGTDRSRNDSSVQPHSTRLSVSDSSPGAPATSLETNSSKGAHAPASSPSPAAVHDGHHQRFGSSSPLSKDNDLSSDPQNESGSAWSQWTERLQDHLRAFFSMHHKLFDLVAFYVVMFAINGQMTSLPTRLEWIGFCVQSIVALRRAFQTSIKHGLGLTSFLGMLDLLVGQLFLHQDRFLGLLPTVANILVYFYVINLTRGLVFGDSVSCLLWFLFGLVDIYRKDPSSASLLDLTPYKVIPVHTVGFGLYILMSELVEVMLHSGEPELIQGRYLTYSGGQKNGSLSRRSNTSDPSSNHLRFELCITEITPFTVSFCLNTLSDPLSVQDPDASAASATNSSSSPSLSSTATMTTSSLTSGSKAGSGAGSGTGTTKKKSGGTESPAGSKSAQSPTNNNNTKGSRQRSGQPMPIPGTSRIVSTADIAVHVNYIPWREVLYHYPDQQSFMIYGLTPSTDYEIEMKVYPYSSFVARVGTKAAPPGMTSPFKAPEVPDPVETPSKVKTHKLASSHSAGGLVSSKSGLLSASNLTPDNLQQRTQEGQETAVMTSSSTPSHAASTTKDPLVEEMERLRAAIQASASAVQTTKASLKKQKRDQAKGEALLRQEIEGLERGQAKAALQDQKRRQKLSFLQESIKQTQAAASLLSEVLRELVASQQAGTGRYHGAQMDAADREIAKVNEAIKAMEEQEKLEIQQWNKENRQLQQDIKVQDAEQQQWRAKADKFQDTEIAPLQLRLQRLEQQQVVWEVAAEASRDKQKQQGQRNSDGRLHDHTLAALEKEVEQLRESIRQTEAKIQALKTQNMELKMRVDQEVEAWENLEEQRDSKRMAHRYHPSRSRSTSRSSSGSGILTNGLGFGGGSLRANGVGGLHSVSPPLASANVRPFGQTAAVTSMGMASGSAVTSAPAPAPMPAPTVTGRFSLGGDLWSSSSFGFVTTLSPTLAASPRLTSSGSSLSSKQPDQ